MPSIGAVSVNTAVGDSVFNKPAAAEGQNFKDILSQSIEKLNQLLQDSDAAGQALATGSIDDIHSAMIAAEKADLALQFTLQIRNKIIDAYNEIMHMQI